MKIKWIALAGLLLAGCSENSKNFSSVAVGMSAAEVLEIVGEPDRKRDVGIVNLWVYTTADRTVVMRRDTVYDVITSASARIDSIETSLDNLGDRIENQAEKAGEKLDSLSRSIRSPAKDTL